MESRIHPDIQAHCGLASRLGAANDSAATEALLKQTLEASLAGQNAQAHLGELSALIGQCLVDSRKILEIEQNIKQHVESKNKDARVFMMLAAIMSGVSGENDQVRYVASLILKNSVKSFYARLNEDFAEELKELEFVCYLMLVREARGHSQLTKKLYSELLLVLIVIVKNRFYEDAANMQHNQLLVSIIAEFERALAPAILESLIQTFELVDDDRMGHLVPYLLGCSIEYLLQDAQDANGDNNNKLMYFIQLLYKSLDWAIGIDPAVIAKAVKDEETKALFQFLAAPSFTRLPSSSQSLENLLVKFNFDFIEHRRLTAKLLTMLSRDFGLLRLLDSAALAALFRLCIQNLTFFFPIFLHFVTTVNKENFDGDNEQIVSPSKYADRDVDFEEFEQEVKAYVVQLISLVQTIIDGRENRAEVVLQFAGLTQDKSVQEQPAAGQLKMVFRQIIKLMLGYCVMSSSDIATLAGGDLQAQNGFLVGFLETDEDQFNQVSIRLTVNETLEQLGLHDGSSALLGDQDHDGHRLLSDCIGELHAAQGADAGQGSERVQQMLSAYESVNQIDLFCDLNPCLNAVQPVQQQEVALFLLGAFRESLPVDQSLVNKVMEDIETKHPLIVMRTLWLLEKLCNLDECFRDDREQKLQAIFEALVPKFAPSLAPQEDAQPSTAFQSFPVKYQCLRTLYRYTKRINLKETYATDKRYIQILAGILEEINANLLASCNEDTVHIPIQALAYYCQIDAEATRLYASDPSKQLMPRIATLYDKYHQDGLLGDDIVDLIKIQASISGNEGFKQVFWPVIERTIGVFYQCVVGITTNTEDAPNQQKAQMREEAQRIVDSNQLKSVLSIFNAYLLRNAEVTGAGAASTQEQQQRAKMFEQICEILRLYRDTYVNLHCVLNLAAFCKVFLLPASAEFGRYAQGLRTLFNKLSSENVGLDDASSLYLGHAIVNFLSHLNSQGQLDDTNDVQVLLPQCMVRILKTESPSAIKSYSLPLCYIFSARSADLLPRLLMILAEQQGKPAIAALAGKIIKAFKHQLDQLALKQLETDPVLHIQGLGLAGLLGYTARDNSFAELVVGSTKLQNLLVIELVDFLERYELMIQKASGAGEQKDPDQIQSKPSASKATDPYGDEYGDDMEDMYGDEYGDMDGFGAFATYGVDMNDENLDPEALAHSSSQEEEKQLLNQVLQGASLAQIVEKITAALKEVGPQTMHKIVIAQEDPQVLASKQFTEGQKTLLNNLFA